MSKQTLEKTIIIRDKSVYQYTKEIDNNVTTVTLSIASEDDINDDIKKIFKIGTKGAHK
ncbi:hypothetical protein GTN30_12640 (plasmid) [Macrococcoides canis]|uniref:Uncharacterized protein n=1 Tax=Macrococcoides canis TaxID=1855823 RepID=A0AAE7C102_9STAP|nr:hypothetical protein [Macrococcus canis]QIH79467.1 hypothetical protein GTN30_12640 [Macrococcus canis]